jgi:Protein of unknown function DUF262/Protein of unknown function (DUF1524)
MLAQFSAATVPLGQLFTNPISIEAPGYQRSFAWTQQEAGQLFEDISQARQEQVDYFLSFMLFMERNRPRSRLGWARPRGERTLEVVDGFQRLTSLSILFCALRDLDADAGQAANPRLAVAIGGGQRGRLSLRLAEDAFFEKYVRAPGSTASKPDAAELTVAFERIIVVRDHFRSELADMEAADRHHLVDFLLDHCCVACVITNDIDRAHQLFTILNARGKPLARKDILKAMLLGAVAAEGAAGAASIWQDLDGRLGEQFENLFSHVRSMYGRPGAHVISSIKEIAQRHGGALPFLHGVLQPAATVLEELRHARHSGSGQSEAIAHTLIYLNRLRFSDWIPPAMLWRLEKGDDAAELAWFLAALDRLALGIRLLGLGAHKRASWFGAVTSAIRQGEDLKAAHGVLSFSRQDVRTMQYNLRDLHARDASTAKYLLLRLTDHLAGTPQSLSFPHDMSVEHVLPRKSSANSQWRGWFAEPGEREMLTESLGNLVLVTKSQNDRAGNQDFARKLEVYFNTPAAPAPALNEALRGLPEWKAAQIRAREAAMLRLIEDLWNFGLKDAADAVAQPRKGAPARRRHAAG